METQSHNLGWIGDPEQLLYVLGTFGADRDADGNFMVFESPVIQGMDGDVVVPGDAECSIGGKRAVIVGLLGATSYGTRVAVY
jgi:hypothetical protein